MLIKLVVVYLLISTIQDIFLLCWQSEKNKKQKNYKIGVLKVTGNEKHRITGSSVLQVSLQEFLVNVLIGISRISQVIQLWEIYMNVKYKTYGSFYEHLC